MIQRVVIDTNASVDERLILAHDERIEDHPRRQDQIPRENLISAHLEIVKADIGMVIGSGADD